MRKLYTKVDNLEGNNVVFSCRSLDKKDTVDVRFNFNPITLAKSAQEGSSDKAEKAWKFYQIDFLTRELRDRSSLHKPGISLSDFRVLLDTATHCGVPINSKLTSRLKLADNLTCSVRRLFNLRYFYKTSGTFCRR